MQSVMTHTFSNAPEADIPRSSFNLSHGHKTTFNAGQCIPVFSMEVMPGDTINMNPSFFARMNTPIYPLMDNLFLDYHFFFVPLRQIWDNFRKFCGEQNAPGDSTDYLIPTVTSSASPGHGNQSLFDYLGVPTLTPSVTSSALFSRAYNHIWNEWYRDQNLQNPATVDTDDGPDTVTDYTLKSRQKRHDYFTSCLPWLQKSESVTIPMTAQAPVFTDVTTGSGIGVYSTTNGQTRALERNTGTDRIFLSSTAMADESQLYADLSTNNGTINMLRQAFQIQKLLERDARSGTRYSEIVKAHFGVDFMDVTYRPEFLGGGSVPVDFQTVPQTSETGTTPQGTLAAYATVNAQGNGFVKSFTEHGIVMGIASVRGDLTYQQGLNRKFSRQTRFDMYWPALAHIGEQAVLMKELYCQDPATDTGSTGTPDNEKVFGYQERWAEYKYMPSQISGKLRSNDPATLDAWHLSQEFTSLPSLGNNFIQEVPPMDRVLAIPTEPDFIMDMYFNIQAARPMPLYNTPGLIDHF
jgi:hypothetical protein